MSTALARLRSKTLSSFVRLLPPDGIKIYPGITYRDVNDVTPEERQRTKSFFGFDPSYTVAIKLGEFLPKGKTVGRRFCVYADLEGTPIGNIVFTEVLDNPHGYGKDDFLYHKWIYPEFRYTKYSRYITGDLTHMLFKGGVCRRLYVYVPVVSDTDRESKFWMDIVNKPLAPCLSKQYPTDSSDVQKYIIPKQIIPAFKQDYLLLELNGEIYNSMDLRAYLLTAPNRTPEVVDRWLVEMDEAAAQVRSLYAQSND